MWLKLWISMTFPVSPSRANVTAHAQIDRHGKSRVNRSRTRHRFLGRFYPPIAQRKTVRLGVTEHLHKQVDQNGQFDGLVNAHLGPPGTPSGIRKTEQQPVAEIVQDPGNPAIISGSEIDHQSGPEFPVKEKMHVSLSDRE